MINLLVFMRRNKWIPQKYFVCYSSFEVKVQIMMMSQTEIWYCRRYFLPVVSIVV